MKKKHSTVGLNVQHGKTLKHEERMHYVQGSSTTAMLCYYETS